MTAVMILVGILIFCVLLVLVDNYFYSSTKPKHSLESIERRLEELSEAIESGEKNGHAIQSDMDIWDYWDSERTRAIKWNKKHPHDKV